MSPIAGIAISLLFLQFNNWIYVHLIFVIITFLAFLIVNKYFVDTPEVLLGKRDLVEFLKSIHTISKTNGVNLDNQIQDFHSKLYIKL